jgi:hypothetical protein
VLLRVPGIGENVADGVNTPSAVVLRMDKTGFALRLIAEGSHR